MNRDVRMLWTSVCTCRHANKHQLCSITPNIITTCEHLLDSLPVATQRNCQLCTPRRASLWLSWVCGRWWWVDDKFQFGLRQFSQTSILESDIAHEPETVGRLQTVIWAVPRVGWNQLVSIYRSPSLAKRRHSPNLPSPKCTFAKLALGHCSN